MAELRTPAAGPAGDQPEALLAEYEAEKPARHLTGPARLVVSAAGVGLSCYAIWWVLDPQPAQRYRMTFLAVALGMTFLVYRPWTRRRVPTTPAGEPGPDERPERPGNGQPDNPGVLDWALAAAAVVVIAWPLLDFDAFVRRAVRPTTTDIALGLAAIALVLEATRRTIGWILPAICLAFLAYAYYGNLIPVGYLLGHVGYDVDRLVGQTFMGVEGIFGVPLDVAATYIVLFTIYGAVLEYSGAGRYFIDVSFAAFGRSATAPARTVTLAGFLLGTVSGSGVATTVTIGSVAWPVMRRAGYPRDQGGGILAASGIGAILSPPTLGAAAFIIAEFLNVSYLQVLLFATIPTVLYYLGIVLAIEADSRRFRTRAVELDTPPLGRLLLRWGYHFSSLFLIVILMALGLSAFRAVLYATVAAFLLSFLDRSTWMTPRRTWEALAAGAIGVLPVAATTAAAGIIVAVVTLTGLGLKVSSIIVDLAGGRLGLAALYSAIAVLVLGLAVPVTASFIIAAVIIGPALTTLGVEPFAAYMFIFYYAVLSEVSPPTALSAVAAAAITGGNPFRTMMLTWRYTLPAFLVPFAFVLSPRGEALLLEGPVGTILLALAVSVVAVAALALATGAWLAGPAGWPERVLAGLAAVLLLYLEPAAIGAGLALAAAAVAVHLLTRRRRRAAGGAAPAGEAGRLAEEDAKPGGPDETDETDETTEARRQP